VVVPIEEKDTDLEDEVKLVLALPFNFYLLNILLKSARYLRI